MWSYVELYRHAIDGHSMDPGVCSTMQKWVTMEATEPCIAHPGFADDFIVYNDLECEKAANILCIVL